MTVLEAIDGARLSEITATETSLRRFLHGLPGVDQVGAEFRAATLATRSIKTTAKQTAIDLAISMIDLTTLEGQDTPGKVRSLCAKARRPDPSDPTVPPVAAVCVYPDLVETAKQALRSSGVKVASVATAFPSGRASLEVRVQDTRDAVAAGGREGHDAGGRALLDARAPVQLEAPDRAVAALGAHDETALGRSVLVDHQVVIARVDVVRADRGAAACGAGFAYGSSPA